MQALACSTLPRPHQAGGGGREPEIKLCFFFFSVVLLFILFFFLIQQTLLKWTQLNWWMETHIVPYLCHNSNIHKIVSTVGYPSVRNMSPSSPPLTSVNATKLQRSLFQSPLCGCNVTFGSLSRLPSESMSSIRRQRLNWKENAFKNVQGKTVIGIWTAKKLSPHRKGL